MKLAKLIIPVTTAFIALCIHMPANASEGAADCQSAVDTLTAGIEAQPDQVLMLFQDALQTNPDCRRKLTVSAIESSNPDATLLSQIIFVARHEFPGEDSLLAEAVLMTAPEFSDIIRDAFMASQENISKALADATKADHSLPAEAMEMDEEIREAIARMTAKMEGKHWPEQELSDEPLQYKQRDEVRVSPKSRKADESSLTNALPVDTQDESKLAPVPITFDDAWRPSDRIDLDETRFSDDAKTASISPREAGQKIMNTAGAAGMPPKPLLPKSSIYFIPPAKGDYTSTVDFESYERSRPSLIIRSLPETSTSPR